METKVIGYNRERVIGLLNEISEACVAQMGRIHDIYVNFIVDAIDGNGTGTDGWYAPEAKKFCESVFNPTLNTTMKEIHRSYVHLYNTVRISAQKWATTTGGVTSFPEFAYGLPPETNFIALDQKDGIVGIDPMVEQVLLEGYNKAISKEKDEFVSSYNKMKTQIAFIGANQFEMVLGTMTTIHQQSLKKLDEVYQILLKRVRESIEKYQQAATDVAGSFK